jgi:hypothetical protein
MFATERPVGLVATRVDRTSHLGQISDAASSLAKRRRLFMERNVCFKAGSGLLTGSAKTIRVVRADKSMFLSAVREGGSRRDPSTPLVVTQTRNQWRSVDVDC